MWSIIFEILGLLLPILITVLIWRQRFSSHLRLLAAVLACNVAGWLLWRWGGHLNLGGWRWGLLSLVLSYAVALLVWIIFTRLAKQWQTAHNAQPTRLKQGLHITGNLLLTAVVWLSVLVVLDVAGNLLAHSPSAPAIRRHSWIICRFMPTTGQEAMDQAALQAAMDQQNQLFTGITRQVRQTRQWLYDQTGLSAIIKQINALQEILGLSHAQCAQLVQNAPALRRLMDHPLIRRVVQNPKILNLIEQAAEGRTEALWALYQHPDINALFEDQALYDQLKQVNPAQLLKASSQADDLSPSTILPVIWYSTVLSERNELDRILQSPQHWQYHDNAVLQWDEKVQLAGATAQVHAQPGLTLIFTLQTQASITVKIDGKAHALQQTSSGKQFTLTTKREPSEVVLLLDFSGILTSHACAVQVDQPYGDD